MKRIICSVLCLIFVFGLFGCSKKEGNDNQPQSTNNLSSAVAEAVAEGKIPEMKFGLGDSIDELKDYYDETYNKLEEEHQEGGHVHSESDVLLNISQGNLSVTYEIGGEKYYYERAKRPKGISVTCSLTDAFGIKHGTLKNEVEATLCDLELKSLAAGEDELYFVQLTEALILRYKENNHTVDFYFSNNVLVATVLRDTDNWTI